jgi:hypothetical protein
VTGTCLKNLSWKQYVGTPIDDAQSIIGITRGLILHVNATAPEWTSNPTASFVVMHLLRTSKPTENGNIRACEDSKFYEIKNLKSKNFIALFGCQAQLLLLQTEFFRLPEGRVIGSCI